MTDKYIGIPWVEGGREFTGADCFGILMLYYKNELGIEIPDYMPENTKLWISKETEEGMPGLPLFYEVDTLEKNDVVWLKWLDNDLRAHNHICIYVGDDLLLESLKGPMSALVNVSKRKKFFHKIYRYRSL